MLLRPAVFTAFRVITLGVGFTGANLSWAAPERELAAFDTRLKEIRQTLRVPVRAQLHARLQVGIASALRVVGQTDAGASSETVDGVPLLETENTAEADGVVGAAWQSTGEDAPVTINAAKLDFAGKQGATLMLWLRAKEENPRDVALISSLDHDGLPANAQSGKGRELRLIDGELELCFSDRFPEQAMVVRTQGAAIRPQEWRHVALTYAGGKAASGVRMFVDGAEVALRVRYDGLSSEPPRRDFLLGADNAKDGARWRGRFDEVRSFPRVLSAAVVRAHFQIAALPYTLAQIGRGEFTDGTRARILDTLVADGPFTGGLQAERDALWEAHLAQRRTVK